MTLRYFIFLQFIYCKKILEVSSDDLNRSIWKKKKKKNSRMIRVFYGERECICIGNKELKNYFLLFKREILLGLNDLGKM